MTQENTLHLSTRHINLIVFTVLSMYPLLGMGIDLIAPSLPAISHSLQVSNTFSKNLISVYLLGYALGSFLAGFLSDTFGRRKLFIGGMFVFFIASMLPALFPTDSTLLAGRLLQGFSIAFAVMARTLLSDILPAEKLMRMAALIATMWGIGPIIGPMVGGYLQHYFNWQACFYFYALYSLIILISMFFIIPETHFNRQSLNLKQITANFVTITTHRLYMGLVILMGITYSLLIAFNTLGPFLIQTQLGKSPVYYGNLAFLIGIIYLLSTLVCRFLVKHYQPEKIILFTLPIFLFIAAIGIILSTFNGTNIYILMVITGCMFICCGIIYPAAMGKSIVLFRHLAGSGSAIMNLINVLITSITALLLGFVSATSSLSISATYFGLLLLSSGIYWLFVNQANKTNTQITSTTS